MLSPRLFVACLLAGVTVSFMPAEDKQKPAELEAKSLFNGKNLDGWVNVNCHPDTFFVKGDEIVTTGTPVGFLRTDRQYENFELDFDWMHVEKERMANSGLFVWSDPLPGVGTPYTRGIEVQVLINFAPKDGWATSHGDIFSIHGARCTPDRPHPTRKDMERCLPSENRVKGCGEWNHYKVIANDGAIKLHVNGKEVSGVSKCTPRKGYLALESEGVECHFKNLKIKELPSTNPKPEECAKVAEGHTSLFNGIDLKGWRTEKDAWKVVGGVLKAAGKAELVSEKKYGPVELVFDWKLPAKFPDEVTFQVVVGESDEVSAGVYGFVKPDYWTAGGGWENEKDANMEFPRIEAPKAGTWYRTAVKIDQKEVIVSTDGRDREVKVKHRGLQINGPVTIKAIEGLEIMNVFVRERKERK